jgi:hypothetical protein
MSYMVSMRDYEGMAGFGVVPQQEVDELNKALSAGYQLPRHDGGSALRVESLEATLRVLTFSQAHIKLWRDIPKLPAFSTSEEYTVQTTYGGESGQFTREGELPQVQDAAYERRVALVKFLGTQREVTHPMTLVRPAHGNVIALETQNGAIWLMERLERALFKGRAETIPESFDGIDAQIRMDDVSVANNVIDMRGGPLTEDALEEMTNIIVQNYGVPSDCYLAPRALSDLAKQFYNRQRGMLPPPTAGRVGFPVNEFMSQAGPISLKSDIFLRSGKNNGVKTAPSSATSVRAPTAPTTVVAAITSSAPGSLFTAADAGTYQYRVTAVNRFGESAFTQETGGVAVVADDGVDLTITDGGGADPATAFRIYRSAADGAAGTELLIAEVANSGAATTVPQDLNVDLPGTSTAYMIQNNLQSLSFRQLAPMLKIPLATLAASIRWMQLLYGTPIVYAPRKNGIFTNLKDD